ncbi:MAG: hypothetical protein WCD30_19970 [Pseudolabrys sp.]
MANAETESTPLGDHRSSAALLSDLQAELGCCEIRLQGGNGRSLQSLLLNASNGEVERQGEMRQGTSAWLWFHSLLFLADSMFSSLSKNIKIVCP